VRKNRFQRMNKRFFDILRTIDPATGLFRARTGRRTRRCKSWFQEECKSWFQEECKSWFQEECKS
jgi:hypothetical protein